MPLRKNFERYAMQAEQMSHVAKGWLDVEEVGRVLGMDKHQSRRLVGLLEDEGWVKLMDVGGAVKLRMRKRGFDETTKLYWSIWQRWFVRKILVLFFVLPATAVLVAWAALLLKRLLGV